MKVEEILKGITPEVKKREIEKIQKVKLPVELQKWVEEYEKVGERNEFFWKFMYEINQTIKPFKIPDEYCNSDVKFLIIIFIILVDDIADRTKNEKLLNEIIKIPHNKLLTINIRFNKKEKRCLRFAIELWNYIEKIIKKYPRYDEFKSVLDYDIKQTLNAMSYTCLINNNPYLINKIEYWLYSPHSLQGMIDCTLDLMCCSKFNISEAGKAREIFWNAQKMARISNCLGSWKKELTNGDFSSSVVVYFLSSNPVNIGKLIKKSKKSIISEINRSSIENELLREWQKCHDDVNFLCERVKLIRTRDFLLQLEKFLLMHVAVEEYYNC